MKEILKMYFGFLSGFQHIFTVRAGIFDSNTSLDGTINVGPRSSPAAPQRFRLLSCKHT